MRNNFVKLFEFGPDVVQKISYPELWQPLCSGEWNHLSNFGRGHDGTLISCEKI